jgi:nitrite reductase (NADH) small subunit
MNTATATATTTDICALEDIVPWTGVAALIGERQVAVFRFGGQVFALGNYDPIGQAFVLSRGLLGTAGTTPFVASPLYKQRFDLRTGACLDDPAVRVPTYPVQVVAGRILIDA